jgi:hypothetical protein
VGGGGAGANANGQNAPTSLQAGAGGAGIQNTIGGMSGLGQLGLYSNIYGRSASPTGTPGLPMSPAQMSMLSSYKTPSLTGVSSPTNLAELGNTGNMYGSGGMNFGSLRTPSLYSGFAFNKQK